MLQTTTKPSIIVNFPAIPATSTIRNDPDSILAYLESVAPHVAAIVHNMAEHKPEIKDRAIRAGLIVAQQKITLRPKDAKNEEWYSGIAWTEEGSHCSATLRVLATVQGRQLQPYRVITMQWDQTELDCTCPDHAPQTKKLVKACKHVLAYIITKHLQEEGEK